MGNGLVVYAHLTLLQDKYASALSPCTVSPSHKNPWSRPQIASVKLQPKQNRALTKGFTSEYQMQKYCTELTAYIVHNAFNQILKFHRMDCGSYSNHLAVGLA